MGIYKKEWGIETTGQGTYEITSAVVDGLQESTFEDGLCNVFVRHTSCSLILMENADPSAMADLQLHFPETDWKQLRRVNTRMMNQEYCFAGGILMP